MLRQNKFFLAYKPKGQDQITYVEVKKPHVPDIDFNEIFPDPERLPKSFYFVTGDTLEGQIVNLRDKSMTYRLFDRLVPIGLAKQMLKEVSMPIGNNSGFVQLSQKFGRAADYKGWQDFSRELSNKIWAAERACVTFLCLRDGSLTLPHSKGEVFMCRKDVGLPPAKPRSDFALKFDMIDCGFQKDPLQSRMRNEYNNLGIVTLESRMATASFYVTNCAFRTMNCTSLDALKEVLNSKDDFELHRGSFVARLAAHYPSEYLVLAASDRRMDFNCPDVNGLPAIGHAVLAGNFDNVDWLRRHGVDLSVRDGEGRHFLVSLAITAAVFTDFTRGQRLYAFEKLLPFLDKSCLQFPDGINPFGILVAAPDGLPYINLLERYGFMEVETLLDESGANMALRALRAGAIDNFEGLAQREGMVTFVNRSSFSDALNGRDDAFSLYTIKRVENALQEADTRILEKAIKQIYTGGIKSLPLPKMNRP